MKLKIIVSFVLSVLFYFHSEAQTIQASPTVSDKFTKRIGNLRFSNSTLAFGQVNNNEKRQDTINFLNVGDRVINLTLQTKNNYSTITLSNSKVNPGEEGWILIAYDFSKRNDYGFILDRILINTDDSEQPQKNINITSTIHEYFAPGDSIAPKARTTESLFSYGNIQAGDKVNHDFTIFNDGSAPLIIRKAKSTCGCIKTTIPKADIAPGQSGTIKVEFDSFGKDGKDSRIITVFLNDPKMSEIKLEMNGVVAK